MPGGAVVPHFLLMRDPRIWNGVMANISRESGGDIDTYVFNVFKFVTKSTEYCTDTDCFQMAEYVQMPQEVVDNGKGDCDDAAILLTPMLYYKGVPAKFIMGYAGTSSHRWTEALWKGQWHVFDATTGDYFPVDEKEKRGYESLFEITPHSARGTFFPLMVPLFLP
jgi:transglutaminase-like putative cysteine protease|tara:strand:+ start:3981 stop:4478 length:498 start_codon:yes stop_codon:yes gene_type:complete